MVLRCKALIKNALVALSLACGATSAWAEIECTVNDPSGTPLNVRSRPNGPIVGALHNEARVFMSDLVQDARGRRWAKIVPVHEGKSGWVIQRYLICERGFQRGNSTRHPRVVGRGEDGEELALDKPFTLAHAAYDGKEPGTLRFGNLVVTIQGEPNPNGDGRVPLVAAKIGDRTVFVLTITTDNGAEEPRADLRVMRLDPSTSMPQFVLSYFWQGAHCCTVTEIATVDRSGKWHAVDGDVLDGDGYSFEDLDGNGSAALVSVDNSFLYAFGCYACSFAPTRINKLVGTDLKGVTADSRYQGFLRQKLREMEANARNSGDKETLHSPGYLGGWVAAKALVGELEDAWRIMLASYDRNSDWPMEECLRPHPLEQCPQAEKRKVDFPEALAAHLLVHRYITPEVKRRLPVSSKETSPNIRYTNPQPTNGSQTYQVMCKGFLEEHEVGSVIKANPESDDFSAGSTPCKFAPNSHAERQIRSTCSFALPCEVTGVLRDDTFIRVDTVRQMDWDGSRRTCKGTIAPRSEGYFTIDNGGHSSCSFSSSLSPGSKILAKRPVDTAREVEARVHGVTGDTAFIGHVESVIKRKPERSFRPSQMSTLFGNGSNS
jgi:hypothetical protein